MVNIKLRKYDSADIKGIQNIFNHFVSGSYAVYTEDYFEIEEIKTRLADITICYVYELNSKIIGFGYLSKFRKGKSFDHTGILTYFIYPEFTGKGLGTRLFNKLIESGKSLGITNYLAHISSLNNQSLSFHKKMGFKQAGIFKNTALKKGQFIDIIWVQKIYKMEN